MEVGDALDRVARKVEIRLEEIEEEAQRLRRFVSALDGTPPTPMRRAAALEPLAVSTNQASGLATRLVAEGKIRRSGRKIRVA